MYLAFFRVVALTSFFILFVVRAFGAVTLTTLVEFNGTNGWEPRTALIQATNGYFYGTTHRGGDYDRGSLFQMAPDGTLTTIASFDSDNSSPDAAIIQGLDGNYYGTTENGGAWGLGGIYEIDLNGTFTNVYSFRGSVYGPRAGLFQSADGTLFGTTAAGGPYSGGAVFGLTTNQLSFLHFFDGTNGENVEAPLIQASDGNLYGVAISALGTNDEGHGCVFRITKDGIFTNLFMFDGNNGRTPLGPLIQATDGNLYGVTVIGGLSYGTPYGTIFRISTNGAFAHVASFYGTNGARPNGGLVEGPDGNFYGTTQQGGAYTNQYAQGAGTIFRVAPYGDITSLISFDGTNGLLPVAGLTLGADGNFYGTTQVAGISNKGNIFRLTVDIPPLFRSIAKSNASIYLTWSAISGRTYQLQYSALVPNAWSNLGPQMTATNGTVAASDFVSKPSARFYRVVMLP
jgi:uncharacterized repeat protein (TIGR03803 family)